MSNDHRDARAPSESAKLRPFSELFARARTGDADAVEALYRRYRGLVRTAARRGLSPLLRRKYDSLDLAHSVFVEVLRDLPRLTDLGEPSFRRLLVIKAENKVRLKFRRHLGREGRRREERIATGLDLAVDATEAAPLAAKDDAAKLARLLGEIDATTRRVVDMRTSGRSFEEIAAVLGLPSVGAARKRHARALAALRVRWEDTESGKSPCKPQPT